MAWVIKIGPTGALLDRTASIKADAVDIALTYNERSTASFSTLPGYLPSLRDEVEIYETDGSTLLFGGLVYQRRTNSVIDRITCEVDCADWSVYGDWTYSDRVYSVDTTLQVALDDLITDCLGQFGISLDATDYTGVSLTAFAWANKSATDALRDLSTKTGYIWRITPQKVLTLIVPGASPAAFNLSDATPNCDTLEWEDSSQQYATKVRVICGPSTSLWSLQSWTTTAGETSWVTDFPAAGPTAGYATLNGIFCTVTALVGDNAFFNWDIATHTLSIGTLGVAPAAGSSLTLSYLAQFPFTVTADSGATPAIEYVTTAPDCMSIAEGQEIADETLARLSGSLKTLMFLTRTAGLVPGASLSVVLADRQLNIPVAWIQIVDIHLVRSEWWEYRVTAIESDAYIGSYLDYFRVEGGASGTAVVGSASGSVTVSVASPYYLGGSRFHAVQVPA